MKIPSEFKFIQAVVVILLAFTAVHAYADDLHASQCTNLLNHEFNTLGEDGRVSLCDAYAGKRALVANTTSKRAFTSQYEGLESIS